MVQYTQVTTSTQHTIIKSLVLLQRLSSNPLEQVASAKRVRLGTKPFLSEHHMALVRHSRYLSLSETISEGIA